jgi:hypothetical protein
MGVMLDAGVSVGFPLGGGAGSQIIGVIVGVRAIVGGGSGSQIIGVNTDAGVSVGVGVARGGGAGSQIIGVNTDAGVSVGVGDVRGGGAGSHTIGRQLATAPLPERTIRASTAFCKSSGSFCQGTILPSCGP